MRCNFHLKFEFINIYNTKHKINFIIFIYFFFKVHLGCWNSTQEIIDLLIKQGHGRTVSDFLQLWSEFQVKITII